MGRDWTFIGQGRTRAVFLLPGGRYVVKIPVDEMGYHDNWSEARQAKRDGWLYKHQVARCRLMKNGWLVMEYVKPATGEELPDWVGSVDCGQVGWTRDGRLVAYDFA